MFANSVTFTIVCKREASTLKLYSDKLVSVTGLEPVAYSLKGSYSTIELHTRLGGGIRTPDRQTLSTHNRFQVGPITKLSQHLVIIRSYRLGSQPIQQFFHTSSSLELYINLAPKVGSAPTTFRLTVERTAVVLHGICARFIFGSLWTYHAFVIQISWVLSNIGVKGGIRIHIVYP